MTVQLVPKPNAICIVCERPGKEHPRNGCPGCFEDRDLMRLPYQPASKAPA